MKIGLVGTNWGRIYITALEKLGLKVDLLVGRNLKKTQEVAKQHNIPQASDQIKTLQRVDLIIVASPADTHLEIINAFPNKAIWCEKPVSLKPVNKDDVDFSALSNCYVNYAFPHLQSVQLVTSLIRKGEIGRVQSVIMKSGFNLPGEKNFKDWFTDIIVHPFAYLSHLFGKFDLNMAYQMPNHNHISAIFSTQHVQMDISFYRSHEQSMLYDITLVGENGDIHLKGGYKPYSQWFFDPVTLNGVPQNAGEYSNEEDIWKQANIEALSWYLNLLNKKVTIQESKMAGLFDLKRAIEMEEAILNLHKKSKQ